jgi:hypothetical protein
MATASILNLTYVSAFVISELEMRFLVCITILNQNRIVLAHFLAGTSISKMVAAILKLDLHFRYCDFYTQHAFDSPCTNFHQTRVVIAHFIARTSISQWAAAAILKFGLHCRFCDFF